MEVPFTMKLIVHFLKAVASGVFIVVGCSALLASENKFVGAALFVVALCAICTFGFPLYTGAVGYARSLQDFGKLGIALLGNMAGCAAMGSLLSVAIPEVSASATVLVERRVYPLHIAFILAFACGILMYTAVHTYKTKQSYIGIFTCVPVFIIAGFEHSIAYMGYMGLGLIATQTVLLNMFVFVVGNGIGAILLAAIVQAGSQQAGSGNQNS